MEKHCTRCGQTKPVTEFYERKNPRWPSERYLAYCRTCTRERTHAHYSANREKYRARERERKATHRPEILARRKAQRLALRTEVIEAYGGECKCCGETEPKFLAIDHIEGGGKKHMKQIGGASSFMGWLKRNGFPEGFQVLCHNCNMAKGVYKICPHQHGTGETSM